MAGWQDIAALGVVALALGYLGRSAYRVASARRTAGLGCGSGCGSCPSGPQDDANGRGEPLVTIGPPRMPSGRGK